MKQDRRGFTIVELLTVMIVISILAGLAITRYVDLKDRAIAARATSDLDNVRLAAYNAMYNVGDWPPEEAAGVVPPALKPLLSNGFNFSTPDYTLDWENLGGGGGGMQVGITVTSTNTHLMHMLTQMIGNKGPFIAVGDQVTLVIVGPGGES